MTKLDKERKLIADRVKKFEQTTREIREMADTLHKKMEQLHLETIATRGRAAAARNGRVPQVLTLARPPKEEIARWGKIRNQWSLAPHIQNNLSRDIDFLLPAGLDCWCRGSTQTETVQSFSDLREDGPGAPPTVLGDDRVGAQNH